jgi:16S rRNA (uracil1498-N3)-methyltransferase
VNLFYQPLINEGEHYLDADESRHCSKVLRKKVGDHITVTDGCGVFYKVQLEKVDSKQCSFSIIDTTQESERNFSIHIAVALTKKIDRIEWFVEKSTELGINEISFIQCEHSERVHTKTERIERVAISAMKQSLKASLPKINPLKRFKDFILSQVAGDKFIAYVDNSNPHHLKDLVKPALSYCVLIGPEGDFSPEELQFAIDHGYLKVSLGKSRLRTETAALAACHTLNLLNL